MKRMSLLLAGGALAAACALPRAGLAAELEIGWGEADITPPMTKRIPLCGQYYQRLADEASPYHSRVKFVALAMRRGSSSA